MKISLSNIVSSLKIAAAIAYHTLIGRVSVIPVPSEASMSPDERRVLAARSVC